MLNPIQELLKKNDLRKVINFGQEEVSIEWWMGKPGSKGRGENVLQGRKMRGSSWLVKESLDFLYRHLSGFKQDSSYGRTRGLRNKLGGRKFK